MSINRDGMFGEFNGYISINVGTDPNKTGSDVSMGGAVSVNVDTRSTAVESLVVNVSNANINVLDQVISANSLSLVNKDHPSLGALTEMRMKGMNVSLGLENGPGLNFSVSESVAVINSQGMAMRVDGGVASISGGSVSLNASADILLNTSSVQIDLDGAIVESGPYLRVEAQGTLQVGGVDLQGGFVFDQSIEETTDNSGAVISTETLTRVAVDQAKLEVDGNKVATADGAMIFKSGGEVAGVLTGSLEVDVGSVGLGAAVSVKINTTNGPVSQKVSLAGREFDIDLDKIKGVATDPDKPNEINTNGFDVVLSSFDIRIGNFIIVEGTGNSATVFVGSGPLYLDDNKLEYNPAAKGLLIENARYQRSGDQKSFVADGEVTVVGLPGLSFSANATVRYSSDGLAGTLTLPEIIENNKVVKSQKAVTLTEGVTTNVEVDITELEIEGQKLKGDFDFTFKDDGSIIINLNNFSMGLGDGSTDYVTIVGTDSKISYSSAGFAGVLNGNVSFANDEMPEVEFGSVDPDELSALLINTTGNAVNALPLLPIGNFIRIEATLPEVDVLGNKIGGIFFFEQVEEKVSDNITIEGDVTLDSEKYVKVGVRGLAMSLGDSAGIKIENGEGILFLKLRIRLPSLMVSMESGLIFRNFLVVQSNGRLMLRVKAFRLSGLMNQTS